MNENRVRQLFDNYIKKFEIINTKHEEYYKWQIAKGFKPMMDEVLSAPTEAFVAKLYDVKKLTQNLIDSYTTPLNGLCVCSQNLNPKRYARCSKICYIQMVMMI